MSSKQAVAPRRRGRPRRIQEAPSVEAVAGQLDVDDGRRGAVERSLHVLEILIEAAAPMGIATIAQMTKLEPNTIHRLLERLVQAGYAAKHSDTKRYSAGAQALFPLSLHHPLNNLRQEAREQLRLLRERYNESICLVVYVGLERIIIDSIQGRDTLSLYETRLRNPLHAGAVGMVLLNEMSEDERRRILGQEPFEATTPYTATTYEALEKDLDALRRTGYAIARQTSFVGINALAAPIYAGRGLIGCVGSTGSAHSLDEDRLATLGEALRSAANLISRGAPSIKAVANFLGISSAVNGEGQTGFVATSERSSRPQPAVTAAQRR